ncbi:MAG: hypothetical protein V1901_04420 [Patescibacteria group bacterium]
MKDIILLLSGLFAGLIIWKLKDFVFKKVKDKVKEIGNDKTFEYSDNIINLNNIKEKFNIEKLLTGIFSVVRSDLWGKTLNQELSIRTWMIRLAIVTVVIGTIYGYGVWKGKKSQPMNFRFNYEERISFEIPEDAKIFDKPANSAIAYWVKKDGTKQVVKVGDGEYISKKMKPYGFILQPYASLGVAMTNKGMKQDLGLGVNLIKYYKWLGGAWLSNNGIWTGVDYKITNNFALGGGVGKGYKGDNLVGFRGQWKF